MSTCQQALILARLDARSRFMVPVADLAAHTGLAPDTVRARLQELWDAGLVQLGWLYVPGEDPRSMIDCAMPCRQPAQRQELPCG